jgi:hypothetical protein
LAFLGLTIETVSRTFTKLSNGVIELALNSKSSSSTSGVGKSADGRASS